MVVRARMASLACRCRTGSSDSSPIDATPVSPDASDSVASAALEELGVRAVTEDAYPRGGHSQQRRPAELSGCRAALVAGVSDHPVVIGRRLVLAVAVANVPRCNGGLTRNHVSVGVRPSA